MSLLLHRAFGGPDTATLPDPEEPIRAELFSSERLEQHAESLAAAQTVTAKPGTRRPLARRLRDNGRVLLAAYRAIAAAIREERAITPAAEWLVDNFHVVEEQIREIQDDLPSSFYGQLPELAEGPLKGFPRVFGLAWAFVAHTDSLFDPEVLTRFVRAYQRVQPLTIGELWAVAITLRIVLVENLRRSAERIVSRRAAREAADAIADRLLGTGGKIPEQAELVLEQFDGEPLRTAFAVQLVQRLRDTDPAVTPALHWLDDRLRAQGTTSDDIVREEHRRQGAMNVTVRNVITSMRLISAVDWSEFFESVSLVDAALRDDTEFAEFDFATRDRYRHALEDLARGSGVAELEVTRRAITAGQRAGGAELQRDEATRLRQRDPGYYLIGKGRRAFEAELGYRPPRQVWLARAWRQAGIRGYVAAILALTAVLLALPLAAIAAGVPGPLLVLLGLLGLIPASAAAVALVNDFITHQFGPRPLPGLELAGGVPAHLRTLVAVPSMLTSRAALEEQIERLEVHHLASSPDDDLQYALLADWTDSPTEHAPGDDELLSVAVERIAQLNERHGPGPGGERFLLLHRRRVWNEGEGKWIGWERKRGKLHELNRLLRGAGDTTFLPVAGRPPTVPPGVRFVITLDADTRLPHGAARRLVGKMAHALNRPSLDPQSGRVVEGYGVLQPRVTPSLPGDGEGSYFQRLSSGPSGIDPYAFAVSDVYQDLFDEGSYIGKGIYDVDVFEAALAGRIPENRVLSHDLLEGSFARAGLVSDVEVVEEAPSRYDVAAVRQDRWARGDWQLLPWILGRGPGGDPARSATPLISRWKMLDNLRRTLWAGATFLALVAGWTLPLPAAAVWTAFVLVMVALPWSLPWFSGLVPRRSGITPRSHLRALAAELALAVAQFAFQLTTLAHQAALMTDAIVRTLWRLNVRQRHMLEWVTAAAAGQGQRLDLAGYYRKMAGGIALAAGAALVVGVAGRESAWLAGPFVLLWFLAPAIALRASRPPAATTFESVAAADAQELRLIARRTWRFFETFVGPEDHWLPPDNFQEDPEPVVAHRTSPTNIGLYLLSVAAAREFGWLGTLDAVERLEATLATVKELEQHHGHLYNWYATRDLRPLEPRYVSSVDSGNFAGHLMALGGACRAVLHQPVVNPMWQGGVGDALALTRDALRALADDRRTETVTSKQLDQELDLAAGVLSLPATTPAEVALRLAELAQHADTITDIAHTIAAERGDRRTGEVLAWAETLRNTIRSHARDLEFLLSWAHRDAAGSAGAALEPLASIPTLLNLPDRWDAVAAILAQRSADDAADGDGDDAVVLLEELERSARAAQSLERRLAALRTSFRELAAATDFAFLYDRKRQLLSIGYQVGAGTLDPSCYDLLASEARLASFVAIAKGDVPARHWFRLGRGLAPVGRGAALISWSGSMFEYLMPTLVMQEPAGSLLEQTCRLVVRRQIQYGAELGVPWGVSESAYNVRDLELTYQYSNFGVPGLGLKRGLSQDAVIAPYATALAAMVDPAAAAKNLLRLAAEGGRGRYGYYEALDYTPARLPDDAKVAIVRAYMAHHQGMTLVAIANALQDGVMQKLFHADPAVQATELLLQERTPRDVAIARPRAQEVEVTTNVQEILPPIVRRYHTPHHSIPRTHILANGRYAVMVTAAGSGYSLWRDLAVTRWREDVTRDPWGTYVYLRDARRGTVWSAGFQPSGVTPDSYEVAFSEARAEIIRRDGSIVTTLEVVVSPENDAEVRRVSVSNLGSRVREIELTSYAEVVLAPPAADNAHPAFSKLFVQTEYLADVGALIATRRRRSPDEPEVWAAHVVVFEGEVVGETEYETDRARFLGRGRTLRNPLSVMDGRPLSNTVGAVLDPVFGLRGRLRIQPGATARAAFWTLVAPTRAEVIDLADKHHSAIAFDRAATLAWTQAHVQLRHLGIGPDEANLFQRLANRVLYSDPSLRPSAEVLERNRGRRSQLWAHGISGDLPIVLVRIDEIEDLQIVRQLLLAHEYWRMKQLSVDLVILNERGTSYVQDLQNALEALVRVSQSRPRPGGEGTRGTVFVLRADLVSIEVRVLLQAAARAVLLSRRGSLAEQVRGLRDPEPAAMGVAREPAEEPEPSGPVPLRPRTEFWNGLGGFVEGGREYLTILGEGQWTPAPWINVVANPAFGFQVSVEGSGYTWSGSSRENQLTQWSNDPVTDPPTEVVYLRDLEGGEVWCPTATPIRVDAGTYSARHGQGYTRFEHASHGIALDLLQYVPLADPIKISRLRVRNPSTRTRSLLVTTYVEWVLGVARGAEAPFVVTAIDPATGALLARNHWNTETGDRVAFTDLAGRQSAWTGDRTEFLGRNGSLDRPAALGSGAQLSKRVGAGMDPCGALQTSITLEPGAQMEIVWFLGEATNPAHARELVTRYRRTDLDEVFRAVGRHWDEVLGTVQVRTPDPALDLMLNRWLLYQTLVCRVWARSAFYQASGAYGFRDQLQDVMALAVTRPDLTREHLLRAAARQFVAGDVQHWWLPPSGRGVRTHVSDDRVWLPYAVVHYLEVTGDRAVLDEVVPFLEAPPLRPGEHDAFFEPMVAGESGTLFEHCARALDCSLAVGGHGLPLIGGGDWNDGMNRVGLGGKGESVWLGWFLYLTLSQFAPIAEQRRDAARAATWRRHVAALREAIEREAWDGEWYRRAWYDDGTPLGSAANAECRIDSLAQSWAVISGAADPARAARAMAAVRAHLVRKDEGLILLFTPPFGQSPEDPGYIKGYPPGMRENGGQYTHAAIWTMIAFAMLGNGDQAAELFSLLNPIHHATTRAAVHRYKVEPYVVCADVYAVPPHAGRGGWTWYTGSSGWMYRAGLEWLLGFRVQNATLLLDPCIPKAWPGFEITYRHRGTRYQIAVVNPRGVGHGVTSVELDGKTLAAKPARIPLVADGASHQVRVVLG